MGITREQRTQAQIKDLLRKTEPRVRSAFLKALAEIRDKVAFTRLVDAIRSQDVSAVIDALNLEPAAYSEFMKEITSIYDDAGLIQIGGINWQSPEIGSVVVRWDLQNPEAQSWLQWYSSQKITGQIIRAQEQAVMTTLSEGYAQGRGPRSIALDIVGRVGANGKRQGGILGLNDPQAQWLANMRDYLANDPARALNMKLGKRDKATIMRAIEQGKSLTPEQIRKITARYERTLLKLRGDTIGRTETQTAVNSARFEAMRQGLEKSGVSPEFVEKTWFHAGPAASEKERPEHITLNKETVQGLYTPFMAGGVPMQYPLDPNAPADQVINCRCSYTLKVRWDRLAV